MDSGRGEEFDALYAKEREKRIGREQLRRKRYDIQKKDGLKNVKRIDAKSIRDVLRKRLKRERIDNQHQQQDDKTNYRSDNVDNENDRSNSQRKSYNYKNHGGQQVQAMKKEKKKGSLFRAKLRELSMSSRTRRKKELDSLRTESTQEPSSGKNFKFKQLP
ncbi:hypothetical protein LOAG_08957 [Loa loa]|uniref:Nucleolar protein 14 n=2 Tax=Loa loa TaxID=7209 RepID=A0A1I7VNV0_LOALO|nr:hypothetical protein LOAG_08957 [Loa loa]EFO19533.1 hypothetical protein LOAG_08957 [Loa loa]